MRARSISLLFALAALALAVWFLVRPRGVAAPELRPRAVASPETGAAEPLASVPDGGRTAVHVADAVKGAHVTAAEPALTAAHEVEAKRLTLLVTDEPGNPIAGAKVEVRRLDVDMPLERATTDAAGRAELSLVRAADRITVLAALFDETSLLLEPEPWPDPLHVTLPGGTPWLEGWLIDDEGAPLAGHWLILFTDETPLRAGTGGDGRFAFFADRVDPPVDAVFTLATDGEHESPARGRRLPWAEWVEHGWPRLVAERRAVLELTVEGSDGKALSDAKVLVRDPPDPETGRWQRGRNIKDSKREADARGADGRPLYTMRPPAGLPLWLEIGHGVDPIMWLGGRAPEHARVDLGTLAPGQRVARTVRLERVTMPKVAFDVHALGNPIEGAGLWCATESGRGMGTRTDANGRAEVDRPSEGWSATVRANGYASWNASYTADLAFDAPIDVALTASGIGIEVVVVDDDGGPFAGVGIGIQAAGDHQRVGFGGTDVDGRFVWRGLDDDARYDVVVGSGWPGSYVWGEPGSAPRTDLAPDPPVHRDVHVQGGVTRVGFRMVPAGSIGGRVLDAGSRTSITLRGLLRDQPLRGRDDRAFLSTSQELASDGRFAFVGLPGGRYRIELGSGEDVRVLTELELEQGGERTGLELRGE